MRASRRCSPPAAGPKSRSSDGWSGRAAGRRWYPGRSTASWSRESEVLIVDFKTNHAPPGRPDEAPRGYVRQLALYRAVLAKLYPQRPVRAALLWTETAELMEISAPALEAELASIISA